MFRVQTPESGHGRVKSPPTPRHRQSPDRGERKKGTDSHSDTTEGRGRAGMKKGTSFQNGRGGTALRWREQGAQRAKAVRAKGDEPKWHYKKALPKAPRGDKAKEVQSLKGVECKGGASPCTPVGGWGAKRGIFGGRFKPLCANGCALAWGLAPLPLSLAPLAPKTADGASPPAKAHWRIGAFRSPLKSPAFCPQAPPSVQGLSLPFAFHPFLGFAHPLPFVAPRGFGESLFIWCFRLTPFGSHGFGFRVLLLPATVSRAPSAV